MSATRWLSRALARSWPMSRTPKYSAVSTTKLVTTMLIMEKPRGFMEIVYHKTYTFAVRLELHTKYRANLLEQFPLQKKFLKRKPTNFLKYLLGARFP